MGVKRCPKKICTVLCVGLQSLDLLNFSIRIHPFHPQPYVPEARIGRSLDASSSIISSFFFFSFSHFLFFPSFPFPSKFSLVKTNSSKQKTNYHDLLRAGSANSGFSSKPSQYKRVTRDPPFRSISSTSILTITSSVQYN